MFTTTSSPKSDEKFKWTIDDISMLKPADIDPTLLQECEEHDSVTELKAQEKINKFFSEVIVPSPMNQPPVVQPLISDASSPSSSDKQMCDGKNKKETIDLFIFIRLSRNSCRPNDAVASSNAS